jgi:XTP/dITP diphosphohydrolase
VRGRSPTTPESWRARSAAVEHATDEENLGELIEELRAVDDRAVAYVCAIAHIDEAGGEHLYEGLCEGTLIDQPRGSGGFGYDPAVVPVETGDDDPRTMAELEPDEKNAISHRGRAARKLAEELGL